MIAAGYIEWVEPTPPEPTPEELLERAKQEKLMEKFKWHKSRAVRRTMNKMVDYVTFLVLGALIGVAITEPMEICNHIWTAALGLGIGCGCEVASIIGHVAYVKMDAEISMVDGWKAFMCFLGSAGSNGYYWSATPGSANGGRYLEVSSSYWRWGNARRAAGNTIRPVAEE